MKTILHVNRHLIAKNKKDGGNRPIYAVKQGSKTLYAHGVRIDGDVEFIDPRLHKPLPCGATVYAVIRGRKVLELIEPCEFSEIET